MSQGEQDETEDLWNGVCAGCGKRWSVFHERLCELYPQYADILKDDDSFTTSCRECGADVDCYRQHVKVVPFSAWHVLPPAHGCPQCGTEHDPGMPHDQPALIYQYWFRSNEARHGRPERWPTWVDAMSHCEPQMRAAWILALADHGITVVDPNPGAGQAE